MSVFHPEGGYPRLIRFKPSGEMPSPDTLTTYDDKFNLVVINQELFDSLDKTAQYLAIRATTTLVVN